MARRLLPSGYRSASYEDRAPIVGDARVAGGKVATVEYTLGHVLSEASELRAATTKFLFLAAELFAFKNVDIVQFRVFAELVDASGKRGDAIVLAFLAPRVTADKVLDWLAIEPKAAAKLLPLYGGDVTVHPAVLPGWREFLASD